MEVESSSEMFTSTIHGLLDTWHLYEDSANMGLSKHSVDTHSIKFHDQMLSPYQFCYVHAT